MRREDIDGATIIKPNEDDTGWLFYHDLAHAHHDHLLQVDAALVALFQPLIEAALYKIVTATNAVASGKVDAKYQALVAFRDQAIKDAQAVEKAHLLGHHARETEPEQGHIHNAVRLALSSAKTAFAATTEKAAQYRLISTEAAALISRMADPHTPETRWDRVARIAREEAAKKAAQESEQSPGN